MGHRGVVVASPRQPTYYARSTALQFSFGNHVFHSHQQIRRSPVETFKGARGGGGGGGGGDGLPETKDMHVDSHRMATVQRSVASMEKGAGKGLASIIKPYTEHLDRKALVPFSDVDALGALSALHAFVRCLLPIPPPPTQDDLDNGMPASLC